MRQSIRSAAPVLPGGMSLLMRQAAGLLSARRQLLVLTYHRILPAPDPLLPDEVDAGRFERELGFLVQHFRVLPLVEAVERLRRRSLPARALCITLDDGYANNCDIALPILRRHSVPATCFVASGFVGGGLMWNDVVIEAIRGARAGQVNLRRHGLGLHELASIGDRCRAVNFLLTAIKHLPPAERAARVEAILAATEQVPARGQMMSEQQIRLLHQSGVEIGAHTVTHPILTRLDAGSARREIEDSRRQLGEIVRAPIRTFAYPNGRPGSDYAVEHVRMVREAGYEAAVSTAWGAARRRSDVLQLPRLALWDRNALAFGVRLLRAYCQRTAAAV